MKNKLFRKLLFFIFAGFLFFVFACSTSRHDQNINEEQKVIQNVQKEHPLLPQSFVELLTSDLKRESNEYQVLAFRASADVNNQTKSYLSTGNSQKALMLSSIAAEYLPWRSDVRNLKSEATNSVVLVTLDLDKNHPDRCEGISERINLLRKLSPDSLSRVLNLKSHCLKVDFASSAQKKDKMDKQFFESLKNFKNESDPITISNTGDLEQQAESVLRKNNSFSVDDFLYRSFQVYFERMRWYRLQCDDLKIKNDATKEKDITLIADCQSIYNPVLIQHEISKDPDQSVFSMTIGDALGLLGMKNSGIRYENINVPLDEARNNLCYSLAKEISTSDCEVAEVEDQSHDYYARPSDSSPWIYCRVSEKKRLQFCTTPPIKNKYLELKGNNINEDYFPEMNVVRTTWVYRDREEVALYLGNIPSLKKNEVLTFHPTKKQLKGLLKIYYQIDFANTFQMYWDVNHSHNKMQFETWWKKFQPERGVGKTKYVADDNS